MPTGYIRKKEDYSKEEWKKILRKREYYRKWCGLDKEYHKKHYIKHKQYYKKRALKYRNSAFEKVGRGFIGCVGCGCKVKSILEINHIKAIGGDRGTKRDRHLYRKIHFGYISEHELNNLDIRCKICNIKHYVETVLNVTGFTVKYNKPTD